MQVRSIRKHLRTYRDNDRHKESGYSHRVKAEVGGVSEPRWPREIQSVKGWTKVEKAVKADAGGRGKATLFIKDASDTRQLNVLHTGQSTRPKKQRQTQLLKMLWQSKEN